MCYMVLRILLEECNEINNDNIVTYLMMMRSRTSPSLAWKVKVLPLNYARIQLCISSNDKIQNFIV